MARLVFQSMDYVGLGILDKAGTLGRAEKGFAFW
jgi:hypothetical protein